MFRIELPRTNRRLAGFFDISEEPACEWRLVASEQIIKPGYRAGLCRS